MPYCHFLLTYSVKSQSTCRPDIEKAERVRRNIAAIDIWEKMPDVETAFRGEVYFSHNTSSEKERIKLASMQVEDILFPILAEAKAFEEDVVVYCVMMVTGVSEAFGFRIAQ